MTHPAPRRRSIPQRLNAAPTWNGLIIPYITLCHRGRRHPIWGEADPHRMAHALQHKLCQICGQPHEERIVVFIRPEDYILGLSHEPGLHPECAQLAHSTCPMLGGLMHHHRAHPPADRIRPCDDPQCDCRTWPPREPSQRAGHPADPWYAAWIHRQTYEIAYHPPGASTPEFTGINVHGNRIWRIRKIRDAADTTGERTVLDNLALWLKMNRITRDS